MFPVEYVTDFPEEVNNSFYWCVCVCVCVCVCARVCMYMYIVCVCRCVYICVLYIIMCLLEVTKQLTCMRHSCCTSNQFCITTYSSYMSFA